MTKKNTKLYKVVNGSKVPVSYLLDYFKEGYSISDFLAAYPWVKKASVVKAIGEIKIKGEAPRYAI